MLLPLIGARRAAATALRNGLFAADMPRPDAAGMARAADGQAIAWSRYGDGPIAVALVHGWMCDGSYWHRQLASLSRRHRVILLDLPGHGQSGMTRVDWSMTAYADDVVRVIAQAGGRRPVYLVGHSMGGVVVALAARKAPRLIGVAACDIFFGAAPPSPLRSPSPPAGAPPQPPSLKAILRERMFAPSSDPALADRIASAMAAGPPAIATALSADVNRYLDGAAVQAMPETPLLLINSDRRPTIREALLAQHPRTDIVLVENSGHFVMLDQPRAFGAAIERTIGLASAHRA